MFVCLFVCFGCLFVSYRHTFVYLFCLLRVSVRFFTRVLKLQFRFLFLLDFVLDISSLDEKLVIDHVNQHTLAVVQKYSFCTRMIENENKNKNKKQTL